MYGLTTIKGLIGRRGLAAFAIAALLTLAALDAPAQAQGFAFEPTFRGGVYVGLAKGQTLRIRIAATDSQGRLIIGTDNGIYRSGAGGGAYVKVFDGSTGALLKSHEITRITAGVHTFDLNRDDLSQVGEPGTGRLQLWIEVVIDSRPAGRARAAATGVIVLPPTFEVMNTYTGVTTVSGALTKTWTGSVTLDTDATF